MCIKFGKPSSLAMLLWISVKMKAFPSLLSILNEDKVACLVVLSKVYIAKQFSKIAFYAVRLALEIRNIVEF